MKLAFVKIFSYDSSLVKFNAAGDRFFVAALEKVSVYVTKTERFLLEFECSKRVLCAASSRVCFSFLLSS